MNYSKLQKFLSGIIIFSLLFGVTFRIPMMNFNTFAGSSDYYDLVGVIVEEEIYDDIDTEIERYTEDLQSNLENTRVVILPTPKDTAAFNIASLLESLYFDGYKGVANVNYESKLVGTVLVGNINLPEVYIGSNSKKTIVPYTDFEDKKFIYNHENSKYEENKKNIGGLKSEIWHGVIYPNLGDDSENIQAIKDYFDKNHDFYEGNGNFKASELIMNSNDAEGILSNYKPTVFYYDGFREDDALNYEKYAGYTSYLENKEDIVYNRFKKELAEKISDDVMGEQSKTFEELIMSIDDTFDLSQYSDTIDISQIPDIQTKNIIEEVSKKLIEIFSEGTLGNFKQDVANAGRYTGTDKEINISLVPYIITVLDMVNDAVLKAGITELEDKIDDIVINDLQEDIIIPYKIEENYCYNETTGTDGDCTGVAATDIITERNETYENILYGKMVKDITSAEECSIFRGSTYNSGSLVEANRGYNYDLIEDDITKLQNESLSCLAGIQDGSSLIGYWGNNTPLNTDFSSFPASLKSSYFEKAIEPIFDIAGSVKIEDTSGDYPDVPVLKDGISYKDCLNNNFFLSIDDDYGIYGLETAYQIPIDGRSIENWTCLTDSEKLSGSMVSYINSDTFNESNSLVLDHDIYTIYSKQIPSYIMHKSPTFDELDAEIKNMVTPSLPIDKDRYIDFKGNNGYTKINYPYLFRLGVGSNEELTLENMEDALDNYLNTYDSVLGESLVDFLKNHDDISGLPSGKGNYYDSIIFSIFWNNLSVSAKYKFVFEYYLGDQFGGNNFNFYLPGNNVQNEIAYIGSKGDSSNMYIMLDPETKTANPYEDIYEANALLNSNLLGYNVATSTVYIGTSEFECAPPEGVPIWQWFPAIACWIQDTLPPTVSFSENECSDYDLLTVLDKEELLNNGGDLNQNGVIDCIEQQLAYSSIELISDKSKYSLNQYGTLDAILKDEDGNTITLDSSTNIDFKLISVAVPDDESLPFTSSNSKEIYNIETSSSTEDYSNYIDFENGGIKAIFGMGEKSFYLKNKISDITFEANIYVEDYNGNIITQKSSDLYTIQVRDEGLFVDSYLLSNGNFDNGANSVVASDDDNIFITYNSDNLQTLLSDNSILEGLSNSEEKLFLGISGLNDTLNENLLNLPLSINIYDEDNELIYNEEDIDFGESSIISIGSYSTSGNYEIIVKDSMGVSITKNITILPEEASKLDISLGTTTMEINGVESSNVFTIMDEFDNVVSGELYDIDIEIDGDGLIFSDKDNELNMVSYSTYEGFKVFGLISTDESDTNTLSFSVKNSVGDELFTDTKQIKTIDNINLFIQPLQTDIKIGGEEYAYEISYKDDTGNTITDFDSRVYLNISDIYGESTETYFDVQNGKGTVEFTTTTVAGENIQIEFQTEGMNTIAKKFIDILPEEAIKMELYVLEPQLEATNSNYTKVKVELKDSYGNLVFNDSSTKADLEVDDKYLDIIDPQSYSSTFSSGATDFTINVTDLPGVAYYKIETTPSLSNNFISISDGSGTLDIFGVGEIAGKIETYYFWNKDKIKDTKYNSLYTTLLGSNYGDITEQDYLAGSLLFDSNNRALGVTSLLNNPISTNDVININSSGNIQNIYNSSDLSQDIETEVSFKDDNIILDLYNNSLNTFIGNIYYNFEDTTELKICDLDLTTCDISDSNTSIFVNTISSDYNLSTSNDTIILKDSSDTNIIDINNLGNITKYDNLSFEIDESNTNSYLLIKIIKDYEHIGNIGFNFQDAIISSSRDENLFNTKINSVKNSILLLIKSQSYSTKSESENKIIYYNDPFSETSYGNDSFENNYYAYERFQEKAGLGWNDGNKTLLSFASGKSIGESTKDYMSFSLINLGDPVVSLKKIKKYLPNTTIERKFDSTVGKLLSNDYDNETYQVFDYNNDSKDDILLIKYDGKLKLLENTDTKSDFIDKGNLSYLVDIGNTELIKTGNFANDGYDDIFFVNNKGKAYLLNNINKKFSRISLVDQFDLTGNIIKVEVFDMDNDGIEDIITLDDSGAINIFYGEGNSTNPQFTKKQIIDDYGVKLSSEIKKDGALVYFDGLYQLQTNGYSDYLSNGGQDDNIPYELTDSLIFQDLVYDKNETQDAEVGDDEYDLDYLNNIATLTETDLINNSSDLSDTYTTFIKSDYIDNLGLKIEKTYDDINGGLLQGGDIISVNITLENTTYSKIENIAYGEIINYIFGLQSDTISIDKDGTNIDYSISGVDFLVDNFSLDSSETITIQYNLETKDYTYGYMKVGLYENGEVGDDEYGDIILQESEENCSNVVEIFRSTGVRNYLKGLKEPICSSNKIGLPGTLSSNLVDDDGNGIPDYIDELTDSSNTIALEDYADDNIDILTDSSAYEDADTMYDSMYDALDDAETIIDGLGCGFGDGCISTPLNWAPLAPGSDPTLFGKPIGDGLKIDEGIPVFSALTWKMYGNYCGPSVWPMSPLSIGCSGMGAGGMLGIDNSTNFFRLFVTPTLTGAMGTAICFGAPASSAGKPPYKGVSPLVPGGNCIVAAEPLSMCEDDGSDGDIESTGFYGINGSDFSLINGNCDDDETSYSLILDNDLFNDYYSYKIGMGTFASDLESDLNDFYSSSYSSIQQPDEPLFSLNGSGGDKLEVGLDFPSLEDGNFDDVIKIQKPRVKAFPSFLMDWVTRQIEEIANKLTDFPTLFIILPDFSGIFDGDWSELSGNSNQNLSNNFDVSSNISDGVKKYLPDGTESKIKKAESGVREAYEFLSSMPLVKIEKQTVNVNVPWIDSESLLKTINSRKETLSLRKEEVNQAKDDWSFGTACNEANPEEQAQCEDENDVKNNIFTNAQSLINSLERNISILEDYKETPERLYGWLNKKEEYLEQILCNINSISNIMGGRISDNGTRFKAWVEAYILVKAMLKSWQMLVDVFIEYDEQCHECKNERNDLQTYLWSLIDMVIPSIPVIRFPKWPDIIIDLHNIRALLTVILPEFSLQERPLVLPYLPDLNLPDTPGLGIDFPKLLTLPTLEISELPDIPSLPTVILPNLPPPPTLPKILSSIEGMVDILRLVTKMMCILKSSPFVPEWRAGDQIAFITERQGFMSFDFLSLSLPEFSFPFVDAIEITTYLDLDFETAFIVEMARLAAMPINSFSNNMSYLFDIEFLDIEVGGTVPDAVEVDIEGEMGMNINKFVGLFAMQIIGNIKKFVNYIDNNKDEEIILEEFKKEINKNLTSERIISNSKLDGIREIWDQVNDMTYSKEDQLIEDLKNTNNKKFDTLKDIINTEIIKNKKLKLELEEYKKHKLIKVGATFDEVDIDFYNSQLDEANEYFINSLNNLITDSPSLNKNELKEEKNILLNKINGVTSSYSINNTFDNKLLGALSSDYQTVTQDSVCTQQADSEYKYTYEGIYIVEEDTSSSPIEKISYWLFDYIDVLQGDEKATIIDYDNDLDEDLLYMVDSELFLKADLSSKASGQYVGDPSPVLDSSDNKFYNGDIFYESVNNFKDAGVDSDYINISFSSSTKDENLNYRLELYELVDKFLNEENSNYFPSETKKIIIDSFAGIEDDITLENENYIVRNNLGYISSGGNLKNIELTTKELKNIKDDLAIGNMVSLSSGNILYAGDSGVTLTFIQDGDTQETTMTISAYTNVELKNGISAKGITGDLYIETGSDITLDGTDISSYSNLPLFGDSRIKIKDGTSVSSNGSYPYINIKYFDNSTLDLDFEKTKEYRIYDLGYQNDNYNIGIDIENNYYYAKIKAFSNNIEGTYSKQLLFAPQEESDTDAPELSLSSGINIPVYKKQIIDFTNYIDENSGIENITEISFDFDLETDSDGDGIATNDIDTDKISITQTLSSIEVEFGEYDTLVSKNIGITIIDKIGNVGYREVPFTVYSPGLQIDSYDNGLVNGSVDDDLTNQPISLYRYRGGVITKLENIDGNSYTSNELGKFNFKIDVTGEGLTLKEGDNLIANIEDDTGIIDLKDSSAEIEVLSSSDESNDVIYPKIVINKDSEDIYYEFINFTTTSSIKFIDELSELSGEGIYIDLLDKNTYGYYMIPEGATYSAGAFVIYRQSNVYKEALFTIYPDGRIFTVNNNYSLKYYDNGDYAGFTLYDNIYNNEVANVLMVVDGDYILE